MVVVTHGTCLKVVKASFSPPSWASVRWSTSSRRCPEMLAEKPTDFIGNKICQKRNAPCHPKAIFEVPWPALCQLVVMNRHEERSAASIIFFTGKHCSGGQSCYNFFCNFFVGHFGSCPLRKKVTRKKYVVSGLPLRIPSLQASHTSRIFWLLWGYGLSTSFVQNAERSIE